MSASPLDTWSLDREIVLTRVYDHPIDEVFAAWTDPAALAAWFSPQGLQTVSHEADIREGGHWRFDMVGPDVTYENLMQFITIDPPRLIVMDHGNADPADPGRFRVTVTFDEQSNGKTVVSLRQLHPTREQRDGTIGFGAVEIGNTTMDKLAAWLAR
ncbi:SRPBCC family protein [Pseudoroseicyclus sp. CXY001]|uniref:SRPBCC family protein n=1 Tax=Pseudoroseicyclus sp. CXY001 TaxID=3242492 RepID=UPI00358DBA66